MLVSDPHSKSGVQLFLLAIVGVSEKPLIFIRTKVLIAQSVISVLLRYLILYQLQIQSQFTIWYDLGMCLLSTDSEVIRFLIFVVSGQLYRLFLNFYHVNRQTLRKETALPYFQKKVEKDLLTNSHQMNYFHPCYLYSEVYWIRTAILEIPISISLTDQN